MELKDFSMPVGALLLSHTPAPKRDSRQHFYREELPSFKQESSCQLNKAHRCRPSVSEDGATLVPLGTEVVAGLGQ